VDDLFASGRAADIITALLFVEAIALWVLHKRTGRGLSAAMILSNLAAGLCLVLALRGALVGAWWGWISACLLAGLVAHLVDLYVRWHR
jgi:hypothetical protein